MTAPAPVGGLLVAGGRSTRMGVAKATIDYRGEPQITFLYRALEELCPITRVAVPDRYRDEPWLRGLELISDAPGVGGPMAALLGAFACRDTAWLAVAVDMPRVDRHSLSRLIELRRPERDATAYRGSDGVPEPLCCIYEPSIVARITAAASTGMWSLRSVLREADVALVDPEPPGLTESVNSPADAPGLH